MMKTVYEIEALSPSDVQVYEAQGGNVGVMIIGDNKHDIRLTMFPHTALMVKRGLARLVDADVADPNKDGYSLERLFKLRKTLKPDTQMELSANRVIEIIDAYVRLIEHVDHLTTQKVSG